MAKLEPDDVVLVAILPELRDLEIARVLGWYRIPLKSAPKMIRVDWIAFYLTAAFGDEKWSIRYLAPVMGYELVSRGELLADDPDHPYADEPYYKVAVGPLVQLTHPIPARRWRRITFLYTTGDKLLAARDVKELTLKRSSANAVR